MNKAADFVKEGITVAQVGKFGLRVGEEWYGVNEPLQLTDFRAGQSYDVLVRQGKPTEKSPNGKKYIGQIIGQATAVTAASITATSSAPAADYGEAKNKRILRQGVYQAVLQSPALGAFATSYDEFVVLVKKTAETVIAEIEG